MAGTDVVKAGYWFFRPDFNQRPVQEIPSQLFTHLYAGFAVVNIQTGGVTFPPEYTNQFQAFPNTVRQLNPSVKALLSVGGPGSDISQVVRDPAKRQTFIQDSITLAITYGYNGLDLCWLYPFSFDNGGDLIALLEEWRGAVSQEYAKKRNKDDHFLLTAVVFHHPAIPCPDGRSFNYPVNPDISVYLDLINVLAVHFYTPFNSSGETGPVHALHTRNTDRHHEPTRCGSRGIRDWIDHNIGVNAAQKLVLGLPFYGYEWNLINPNVYEYFALANPGDYKDYRTIQEIVHNDQNYQTCYDSDYVATYSHNKQNRKWIGYEDETSISEKVTQAIHGNATNGLLPLRGCFAWNLGGDDDNWTLTNAAFGGLLNQP